MDHRGGYGVTAVLQNGIAIDRATTMLIDTQT
jgi:hypothetical protein